MTTSLATATAGVPLPVRCVVEHLHRDRSVADDACRGRFTHAGIALDLGVEPDWLEADLPHDEEWRIEWSKLYVGLDLAHAYASTGERRYADTWARLIGSWIDQVPLGLDTSDVAARRVQNLVYAWIGLTTAPDPYVLAPDFAQRLTESIAGHCARIRDDLTPERNHRTLELYALLVCALAVPTVDPDGTLLELAVRELEANLATDWLPDGVQREASTHYHLIALRSHLGALANLRDRGLEPSAGYVDGIGRALDFAMHCHRPDGEIPMLSDSDGGSYADVLLLGAELLGREDLRWVATQGREGSPPTSTAVDFPHGGYLVQRSGWGDGSERYADERFLVLDCGPVGDGGHGHYDALSVEAYGYGRPLVVDPGRFTYDEGAAGEPNWRHWFKGTAAHNTVTVDGLDQLSYRRGKPKGPRYAAQPCGRLVRPGLDVVRGTVQSHSYDALHERTVAFVDDRLWVVVDRVSAPTPHVYDLRFQLAPEAQGQAHVAGSSDTGAVVSAPGLALVLATPAKPVLEEGWVSPVYGVRVPAPVVSVVAGPTTEARFVTAIVPLQEAERLPKTSLQDRDGRSTLTITWQGCGADVIVWDTGDALGALPAFELVQTRGGEPGS